MHTKEDLKDALMELEDDTKSAEQAETDLKEAAVWYQKKLVDWKKTKGRVEELRRELLSL